METPADHIARTIGDGAIADRKLFARSIVDDLAVAGWQIVVARLLHNMECPHAPEDHQTVSDVVIYQGLRHVPDGQILYEVARQIVACRLCGSVVEVRDIERDDYE